MHGLLNYMGLNRRPPSHSVSDTAKAKTDVSTFVHAFHSQPLRKLLRSPTSVSYRLPFPALGPGDPARKKHYPSVLLFLPVTVRIFTCYFPSPPLSGTKSGHWPPWFFSLVTRSFYLLNSSLCITPAKSPLVEPTSCQIDPVFLTFPKRHRPIMNMLWHLPPFCFPIQSVPLWSPFLHSSFSWNQYIPNSLSQKNQKKNFAMGLTRK